MFIPIIQMLTASVVGTIVNVSGNPSLFTKRSVASALFLLLGFLTIAGQAATTQLASKNSTSCAIDNGGNLFCWGNDSGGQLGQGRILQSMVPRQIGSSYMKPGHIGQAVIAATWDHTLAIQADGTLWSWGANSSGQLGDGTTTNRSNPRQVGTGYTDVAAGFGHALALKTDGSLWAWGGNSEGELGDSGSSQAPSYFPKLVGTGYKAIFANNYYSLALKSDGTLWSWGSNGYGQLGYDTTTYRSSVPKQLGTGFTAISAGLYHGLAIKADGSLWSWGLNNEGQLGDGTTTNRSIPRQIGTGYAAVAAGDWHSLAVKADGSLWAWGNNGSGQLGDGTAVRGLVPKQVGDGFASIAAFSFRSVAVKADGSLWAWGLNSHGQLGDGTTVSRFTPTKIGTDYASVAVGREHTVAVKNDGSLWAWGGNGSGQLGDGAISYSPIPKLVGTNFLAIAEGDAHSLALKSDGTIWAWGNNDAGQLGDGTDISSSLPKQIGTGYTAIAAGAQHSLAVKADGSLWSWGANYRGQLGDGTTTGPGALVPKLIGIEYASVGAGTAHSLAIKKDGSLWAWGYNNSGQLGDGTYQDRNVPKQSGTGFKAISAGGAFSLGIKLDGSLWAWGQNDIGQLGVTLTEISCSGYRCSSIPLSVGTGYTTIAAGLSHSLAIKTDGSLWAWGNNGFGQFGDGTIALVTSPNTTPKQIGTDYVAIAGGQGHSLAVKKDGSVWTWGYNNLGQIGDGTYVNRLTPTLVSNPTADGPLDLMPEVANNIPPELIPPFWLQVSKANDVSTAITYNPEDLNKTGSVYVVAYLDPASPLLAGATPAVKSTSITTKGGTPLVAAVLTRSGWKQTSSTAPTEPLYSGTLSTSSNTFSMYDAALFDQTKDNGLFCVSYAGSSTTSAKGLIRSVVSGVDASLNQCPPIQLGSTADTTAPSIPLSITATAAGPGQVNLSWSAATDNVGVAHYNIYRGTSLIATVSNVTSYTDTSPQASTAYSYSVMACDIALNCSGQSTNAQANTPAQPNVILSPGWNLVGNGGSTAMNVATLFGDASKVYSLWKWVRSGNTPGISYPTWAMYAPGQADGGAAYAASKGYESLTSIQSAEGFWVNAKSAFSVAMTAPAWILSSTFQPGQSNALPAGWSLIATGEANTASAFNKAIGETLPTPTSIPNNLTTLWAWENSTSRWYFYAPSLEAQGTLQGYVSEKGYLDFGSRTLTPTAGVWVNR